MTTEEKPMREQQGPFKEGQNSITNTKGQGRMRFGNYELISRIDVGGMGEVYLARQLTVFGREVAIKIIRSDLVHDSIARRRFLREAEVNAHLQHEHILPLFEFGEEQGRLFMATPYIAGGTLAKRLQSGPLSPNETYQLFTALLKAVAYIHRRGVIHRDLKPGNILLDQEPGTGQIYVRLIDFGIATIQGMSASPPLTSSDTEVGTIAYMAPERLSGVAAYSNDIYSLGVILYQMVTGRLPKADQRLPLPPPLEYIVQLCMAPRPEERFARAEDVLKAFEEAYRYLYSMNASGQTPQLSPLEPDQDTPQPLPAITRPTPITPVRVNTPRAEGNPGPKQEVKSLQSSGDIRPSYPPQQARFKPEDYDAPTTNIDTSQARPQQPQVAEMPPTVASIPRPPRRNRRSRNLLFALIPLSIVVVLISIAALLFFELRPIITTTATVSFSPQVQVVKQVFQITAKPSQQNIDTASLSIPAKVLTSQATGTKEGTTTGQVNCGFLGFGCQQAVSSNDVSFLEFQIEQGLEPQINQDLQNQSQKLSGANLVSKVFFSIVQGSEKITPPVNTVSKTVSVTLTEQGSIEYFLTSDATKLVTQLLQQQVQQLGPNYVMTNGSTQIGQPVIQSVDNTGVVTIAIAAGTVAQYQFPASQLSSMQDHLKGLTVSQARAYLHSQTGVDSNTISIHISSGDTFPGDAQQIKITPTSPSTIPTIQLPTVTPVATATQ